MIRSFLLGIIALTSQAFSLAYAESSLPGVSDDSVLIMHQRRFSSQSCGPNKSYKIRYANGLECLKRKSKYDGSTCMEVRPFLVLEYYDKKDGKKQLNQQVQFSKQILTEKEIGAAYAELEAKLGKAGDDHTPFISKTFMINNAIAYAAYIFFPITVPLDVVTFPFQVGMYEIEKAWRMAKYHRIHQRALEFVFNGKQKKPVKIKPDFGYSYGYDLKKLVWPNSKNWLNTECPN